MPASDVDRTDEGNAALGVVIHSSASRRSWWSSPRRDERAVPPPSTPRTTRSLWRSSATGRLLAHRRAASGAAPTTKNTSATNATRQPFQTRSPWTSKVGSQDLTSRAVARLQVRRLAATCETARRASQDHGHRRDRRGRFARPLGSRPGSSSEVIGSRRSRERTLAIRSAIARSAPNVIIDCAGASTALALGKGWRGFRAVDTPIGLAAIEAARRANARMVYAATHFVAAQRTTPYVDAHERVVAAMSSIDGCVVRATGFFSAFAGLLPLAGAACCSISATGVRGRTRSTSATSRTC